MPRDLSAISYKIFLRVRPITTFSKLCRGESSICVWCAGHKSLRSTLQPGERPSGRRGAARKPGQLKSICSGSPLSPPSPHPPQASFRLWAYIFLFDKCFQKQIFYKMLTYANLSFKTIPIIKPKCAKTVLTGCLERKWG